MRSTIFVLLFLSLFISSFGQDRQQAIEEFNAMKSRAAELERVVLAPDDLDKAIAAQRSVSAIRILPRETYDNSFSSIRGGGCYYGFYFRTPDYGRGSELHWGDGYLKTGSTELALMADLGEIPIDQISRDTRIVVDFANYKVPSDLRNSAESVKARVGSLTIGETTSLPRVKPVVGHSYVVRSVHLGYYDILVAFTVFRRDADNSLILLWKLLQQNDTPREARDGNIAETDDQLHAKIQGWLGDKRFKGIVFKVSNRVVTLSGSADRQFFGYAIELANRSGASKIINLLEPR